MRACGSVVRCLEERRRRRRRRKRLAPSCKLSSGGYRA
jgi:hypothetical protein